MPEGETWRYRGQTIGREQIAFLREFIRDHPDSSRWKLSRELCEVLGWKQANGALRDVVCRGLLLMLVPNCKNKRIMALSDHEPASGDLPNPRRRADSARVGTRGHS